MKKIILSLSVLAFCAFAEDAAAPVTEVPVSAAAGATLQEPAQAVAPERSTASTKKKHHAKKSAKKKHKKKKSK